MGSARGQQLALDFATGGQDRCRDTGWWSRRITGEHRLVYRIVGRGAARELQRGSTATDGLRRAAAVGSSSTACQRLIHVVSNWMVQDGVPLQLSAKL
jgi:hypothetical protein